MNIQEKRRQLIDTAGDHYSGTELEQYVERLEKSDKAVEEEWELAFGDAEPPTEQLWFWDCAGESGHLIRAESEEEAYEVAIKKRMEWTGDSRASAESWFENSDILYEITNNEILEG